MCSLTERQRFEQLSLSKLFFYILAGLKPSTNEFLWNNYIKIYYGFILKAALSSVNGGPGLKNDENAYCRATKSAFTVPQNSMQNFLIHIDDEPKLSKAQGNAVCDLQEDVLNPAITSLSRPALTNVFVEANRVCEGS